MDRPFVHLHCHSHYSLLDGAASISKLVERTVQHGMNSLALTDHGNLHGALEFYRCARAAQINPIIGYEAYVAAGSRWDRSGAGQENSYHLTLLCQNRTGFENLIKMATAASLEGFYFKPRLDRQLLEQYREGIICLSGCVSSEFSRAILRGGSGAERQLDEARDVARWFSSIFGDRYFIEIMNNGVELQRICLDASVQIADELGIPLVATSDCHYVDQEDADAQDVMLCINTGRFRTDAGRMRMDGKQYHLRHPQEMYAKFPGLEEAVARSQQIADTVDIQLQLGQRHFPVYDLPAEESPESFLRRLCLQGLQERYRDSPQMCPGGELAPAVRQRLDRELEVINKLGFPNYFLIVWDFVREARSKGIPVTARGSGVGALVSYALYLSHVCPIKYDLLFERFLDESRREAPDIDMDFCKQRRNEIIQYVKQKYGEDNVAQIGTFGTLAARAAIKDVGRVLGIPLARVNQITSMVPEQLGITIEGALRQSEELRSVMAQDAEVAEVINFARKLEGLARNVGTHAAAVVIGDCPLQERVPLARVAGKEDVITQWSMGDVEAAGLLKMDFLGLRNLTILSDAVQLIEQNTGQQIDLNQLPLDDSHTFHLLQRGETKGIFQLESGGIRDLLQRMKPDHFLDIVATNALYRPGPLEGGMVDDYVAVKHGKKRAEYQHPVLREVLQETHGVMVYQEQVMRILNRLGGIPLASAYTCIKAISKKSETIINANREQFLQGAMANGLKKKQAEEIWVLITKFAGYGFNKSHSTAYAMIAYQTAYLKAHYPLQFMAALLSSDIPGRNFSRKDALVEHLEDCRRMDIEVVPPHVNASGVNFTVADGRIHFALSAVKGCGGTAAESIVNNRQQQGPFRDLYDFCERMEPARCNRSTVETLIKAGAMDGLNASRAQLLAGLDRAMQSGATAQADRRSGQMNLFGGDAERTAAPPAEFPEAPVLDHRQRLAMEKEVLGFYLASHPLAEYENKLRAFCSHTTTQLAPLAHRHEVILGGMVSAIKYSHVRRSRDPAASTKYVMFDLEDMEGSIRCIQWPDEFAVSGQQVQPDAILVIRGSIDRRGDEPNVIVNEIIPLDQLDRRYVTRLRVRVKQSEHGPQVLEQLYEIVRGYPGACTLQLSIQLDDGTVVSGTAQQLRVEPNEQLLQRLEELLGCGCVQSVLQPPPTAAPPKNNGRRRPAMA